MLHHLGTSTKFDQIMPLRQKIARTRGQNLARTVGQKRPAWGGGGGVMFYIDVLLCVALCPF